MSRRAARGGPPDAPPVAVSYRCLGRSARPHASPVDPGLRACEEIVVSKKRHSGAARRAEPGTQEHLNFQICSTSGVHGFRARGQCPRPGMTTFGIFSHAPRRGRLLPPGDADFPGRWRAIKIAFAKSLPEGEPRSPVMTRRGERGIWQRRYWKHTIRDERDFAAHGQHAFQPGPHPSLPRDPPGQARGGRVRDGEHPADWPHSSFRRCVASGSTPPDGQAAAPSRKRPASGGEIRNRPRAIP